MDSALKAFKGYTWIDDRLVKDGKVQSIDPTLRLVDILKVGQTQLTASKHSASIS